MRNRFVFLMLMVFIEVLYPNRSESDIISYLRFEEGGGTIAQDQTGLMQGELFYMPSVQWSTDIPTPVIPLTGVVNNYSLWFGGFGFVDLSNNNDVNLGTNFTVEFFFKPESLPSVAFGFSPGSALGLAMSDNVGTSYFNFHFMGEDPYAVATSVTFGAWQHLALVKEPSLYRLYINGNLVAQDSLPSSTDGPYWFPGTGLTGDRTVGGDSGSFRGWLDEFRISDEALTPDQFLNAVPEPGTFALVGLGGLAFLFSKPWKKRRKDCQRVAGTF